MKRLVTFWAMVAVLLGASAYFASEVELRRGSAVMVVGDAR